MTSWTPTPGHGTWHPQGRWLGAVTYIHRLSGQPTGLYFKVPRWRYWWISALIKLQAMPLLGAWADRRYAQMSVTYHYALPQVTRAA